tara:strand:- start:269 stop:463 length:195 start_codon:yes stop_codon:yes gene_type:complete
MLLMATLLPILPTMDVPIERMRISKANVRWLLRNLRINNGEHEDIELAISLLKELRKSLHSADI